jgi:diguanylate cyclase (GGDEF)-like protein/PAS domain S-box-containing protein
MSAGDRTADKSAGHLGATASDVLSGTAERERQLLRSMIDLLPAYLYAKDAHSRFIACNLAVARGMGVTPAELIGKTDYDFYPRELADAFYADEQEIIRTAEPLIDREERAFDPDTRTVRYLSTSKVPLMDSSGKVVGIVGIGRDITDRKRADERVHHLATHDALTELPNRMAFSERLNAMISASRLTDTRFALMFVDLDHFKLINDSLGHEAGDSLLKQAAGRLADSVRPGDLVARLGGDEFVVLCPNAGEALYIEAVAAKIVDALTSPMQLLGQECRVSASIGIALYPNDGDTERALMRSADSAMYCAKQDGKNNYRFFSAGLRSESLERVMLENELRHAIGRRQFLIHYLAKVDLKSRAISGAEALLRWHHPDLGIIAPSKFLPLAEDTGLIVPIGYWTLRTACEQHMAWQREGFPSLRISINLTARQFYDDQLVPTVLSSLEDTGMAADMLELETAESTLMQDREHSARTLSALKQAGVHLAIDNFGASYVSLANIQRFPIDTLKVDRSLLRDVERSTESRFITEAIIALGKSLSLTVIAEGVETRRQANFLRDQDCDAMQGFYINEPAAAADFSRLLKHHAEQRTRRSDRSKR